MALLAPRPEYFYAPFHEPYFHDSTLDSHMELMNAISSNPDVLDIIDDHLDGQLWEDVKEFISANPDILDRLDGETLAGLVKWMKKKARNAAIYMEEKARKAYHKITGKKKNKDGTSGEETKEDEPLAETKEEEPVAETSKMNFRSNIRGCRTVSFSELTHLKLTIMKDPDVLDDMNAHLRDGLWEDIKGVIAADPALIHHLPCMGGKAWDWIKKKATQVRDWRDSKKSVEQLKQKAAENRKKKEAKKEHEEALKELKESRTSRYFDPYDSIGIRVPTYGGDGRLSASILNRYSTH